MSWYSEKLKDPRWQKKRLEMLSMDEWTCTSCGATDKPLHVHHKAYRSGDDPWEAEVFALTTLCDECHQYETENKVHIDNLMYLIRSMFDADSAREMLRLLVEAGAAGAPMCVWVDAFFSGIEQQIRWFRERSGTSGAAVSGVPEKAGEGQGAGGDQEGAIESFIQHADGGSQ